MSAKKHYIVGTGDGADFATITAAMDVVADGDIVSLQPGLYEELIHIHADITLNVITDTMETINSENENHITISDNTKDDSSNKEKSINANYTTSLSLQSLLPLQEEEKQQQEQKEKEILPSQEKNQQETTLSSNNNNKDNVNVKVKESTADALDVSEAVITNGIIINSNATLQHLNIAGRIDVRAGHVYVSYCEVHHGKDGIRVWESASLTLQHSRIHHCNDDGDGIYFMPNSSGNVNNCDVYECRVNGVHARHARVALSDSRIRDCKFGIYFCDHASGLVQHNTIEHITRFGVYITEESEPVIQGNTISECGIHTVMVSNNGKGLISDNTLKGSVHVCNECPARLGENRVSGVCDVDINTGSSSITPQPFAQSVHAK